MRRRRRRRLTGVDRGRERGGAAAADGVLLRRCCSSAQLAASCRRCGRDCWKLHVREVLRVRGGQGSSRAVQQGDVAAERRFEGRSHGRVVEGGGGLALRPPACARVAASAPAGVDCGGAREVKVEYVSMEATGSKV